MRTRYKILFTLILIILSYMFIGINPVQANNSYEVPSKYFGITEYRTLSEPNFGYSLGNPVTGGANAAKIWNISQYNSSTSNNPIEVNAYCLKGGFGFTDEGEKVEYNLGYDMYDDRGVLESHEYEVVRNLVGGDHYNEILALANLVYLPGVDSEEALDTYLAKAGIDPENPRGVITLDEIKAVQQAAFWYFTNYGEGNGKYDKLGKEGWLYYADSQDGIYDSLSNYNPTGELPSIDLGSTRQAQAETLYNYLVTTAKENAVNYANTANKNYKTKLTMYLSSYGSQEQPIIVIEREKQFDLSLRKYITKINNQNMSDSRTPQIDLTNLKNLTDTTAIYKHRKDPVLVKYNDTVTYQIQVYNEGNVAGYVNEIKDQLPSGLKFSRLITEGYTSTYDESSNIVTFTRNDDNDDKLSAYDEGNTLDSTILEFECIVNTNEADKILTNVAWISVEETEDGKIITDEIGDDIDSEPSNAPGVDKDNMENYKGNDTNQSNLDDSNYFYKGEQDDDDFEKLTVIAMTSIDVSKKWDDEENQDGKRVETVTVELLRDGVATGQTITLNENNNWSGKFDNLLTKIDGKDVTYSVKETTSISGYNTVVSSEDSTNGKSFTITNSYTPETTKITATKVWEDNNNQDGKRPPSVEFELYKNGTATGNRKTLTEDTWTATFTDLPVYENGQKITYTVREVSEPEGYTSSGEGTEENSYTITNRYTPETTEITATKVWEDNNNQDGKRPPSVEFELYKNGIATGNRKTLTENTWTATFTDLPVYENGEKITYTVKEVSEPEGYTSSGDGTEENRYTITNTYTPETTEITATKVWEDNNNQDGKRPPSVKFELYKNGTATGNRKTLTEDTWTATFTDLPVYENGQKITYTVREVSEPEGYTSSGDGTEENSYTITNTYTPETTEITATKVWEDNNNQDGKRPPSVEFELYKNGIATGNRKTLTEDTWTVTFTDLPVYENGQKITYTVKEVSEPEGYTSSGEGTEENSYTITNSYTPEQTSVNVNKVWNDNNNQDGVRPDEIQVQLVKEVGGQKTELEDKIITLSDDNQWKGTFDNLPVYENGEKITYSVKEITISGYSVNITQNSENNFTITNTHTPGVTSVNVNKVWDDQNDQDGLRPDSIEVELLKNGEPTGNIITLSEENHWTGTFNDLPIKENGEEIDYTVREITQIEGYTTEITENTETANNTNNTQNLENVEEPKTSTQTYATKDMVRATIATVEPKSFRIINTHLVEEAFDLSLRKFIIAVSEDETIEESDILMNEDSSAYEREPVVDASNLNTQDEDGNMITTAIYNHTKEPVLVKKNDIVVYMLRVYNEGEQDGYASEIKDYLPPYLTFVDGEFNRQYGWEVSEDGRTVTTRYLENSVIEKPEIDESGNNTLSYVQVPIMCRVSDSANANEDITNIADITEYQDKDKQPVEDRDSEQNNVEIPNDENLPDYKNDEMNQDYVPGQEDDDDFEKIYVEEDKEFDLALRKFISEVDGTTYNRVPSVDLSGLESETTAIYNHTKDPVLVKRNSVIIYTIRVYNEGDISGYAEEVTDYLPEGLEFLPEHEINIQYEWQVSEDGRIVTTDYLSSAKETGDRQNEIQAFDGQTLDYKEVQIACRVKDNAESDVKLTNLAEITEDSDEDRDSTPDNVEVPNDEELPEYKDDETGEYIPGQEDDDDFEKVIVQDFDLALRKFIVAVSDDETVNDDEYLRNSDGSYTREPVVDTSLLNTTDENGNIITTATYNHTKEPVLVQPNNYVIYMLRVYNEGDMDGYASEIKDHLPPYLTCVDSEFNREYGWEVSEDGRTVTTKYLENSLINAPRENAEGELVLSYMEVPIMCRVNENAIPDENITNIADITEYQDENKEPVIDRDSSEDNVNLPSDEELPGYKDDETGEYIPGQEDDDDFEKVVVKIFDLSLRKWVTQAIVIDENGNTTITETGHQPYDDPEDIVKVEIHRNKLNQTTVKFRYSIRVTNEGGVAGYAEEVTDYVPEGLRFIAEDNPGWTDEGENIISTRLLENTLLQPGEYADIEVVLTWINGEDTMGVMTNTAEISEDYNDYGVPDIDSTPDNRVDGEDDIDDAPVMLSISTGQARIYFTLGFTILITIAGGIVLIKKFVI